MAGSDHIGNGVPPEILLIAEQRGITPEAAAQALEVEHGLISFAESARSHPDFVDFMLTPGGASGILLVEPGASMLASGPVPANVEVRSAALSEPERERAYARIASTVSAASASGFIGLSYDSFENAYTVWLDRERSTGEVKARVAAAAESAVNQMNRGASVAIAETAVSDRFRGGKRATQGGALCTTTFGVWKSGVGGGYLTAGHRGTGTWTVNGNTSTSVQDRQISRTTIGR